MAPAGLIRVHTHLPVGRRGTRGKREPGRGRTQDCPAPSDWDKQKHKTAGERPPGTLVLSPPQKQNTVQHAPEFHPAREGPARTNISMCPPGVPSAEHALAAALRLDRERGRQAAVPGEPHTASCPAGAPGPKAAAPRWPCSLAHCSEPQTPQLSSRQHARVRVCTHALSLFLSWHILVNVVTLKT